MKILVLLIASFCGFNLVCQDVTSASQAAQAKKVTYVTADVPVATIALDTVEVVYVRPAALAANSK